MSEIQQGIETFRDQRRNALRREALRELRQAGALSLALVVSIIGGFEGSNLMRNVSALTAPDREREAARQRAEESAKPNPLGIAFDQVPDEVPPQFRHK